jgi:O-antigen/teichoic acid export membrane protein
LLYAIGNVLSKAIAFLMLPIYTRYLSPADYGIAALIEMTLDVIAIIAGQQVAQGVFRFYHKADTEDERRAVVSTTLTALLVSYALLGAAVFLSADWLSRLVFKSDVHGGLIRIAAGNFALQSVFLVPLAYARVRELSGVVVVVSLSKLVVQVALNLVFIVGMKLGVQGVFLSTFVANLVFGIGLGIWAVRQVGLTVHAGILRSLVRYGTPLIGVQAAQFTMTFSDRYFLQAAGNEAMVGLYNLAYQFGFLLLMLGFIPFEMVWGPRRFQVARRPDPSPVLSKAFRLISVSLFTTGVGIALFVGDLLRVMSTPPFHPAARIVPIILIAYVFHGWAMLHDIGVLVKERTEFLTVANWVAAFVALVGFSILIPRYFAMGAAMAAVLAFGTRWALTYTFSQRLWKVHYEWAPIAKLAVAAVGVATISALLPAMPLTLSLASHVVLFVAYAGLVLALRVITPDEKAVTAALLGRAWAAARARVGPRTDMSR